MAAGRTAGQLSIVMTGREDAAVIHAGGRGVRAVMKDPSTITFHRHKQREFEAVRDAIQAAVAGAPVIQPAPTHSPPEPAHAPPPQGPPAGWYANPQGSGARRWWDGTGWTEHLQS